jgi:hypothetical protein
LPAETTIVQVLCHEGTKKGNAWEIFPEVIKEKDTS